METMIAETAPTAVDTRAFVDRAREVLHQLAVLIRNSYLHDLGNQVFEEPLDKLQGAVSRLVAGEGALRLERSGEEFFANGVRLRMEIKNLHAYKYVMSELEKRDVGGVSFDRAPEIPELTSFLIALSQTRGGEGEGLAFLNDRLRDEGVLGIQFLPPREDEERSQDDFQAPDRRERAMNVYQQALDFIRESMAKGDPAQVNVRKAKRSVQKLVDLSYEEGNGFSLAGMASIKAHDDYTFNHMVNVCVLAIAFGQRLGLKRQDLAQLGLCALYHDMGKLHIPLDVLNNSTDLTEEQWAVMGNHTVYAARTLFPLIEVDRGTVNRILTALQHHLRYDGTGYPELRIRKKQSLYARITAIVDTFDAMTTKRIYQRQYLPDEAIALMHEHAGTRYDPLLVKAFVNCMGIYPIGSTVALSTGELAVVIESNPDPDHLHQPKVRIVTDVRQRMLPSTRVVDLSQVEQAARAIRRCVDPEEYGINSAHYAF